MSRKKLSIPLIIVVCCWLTAHAVPFESQNTAEVDEDDWKDDSSKSYDKIFIKKDTYYHRNERSITEFLNHVTPDDSEEKNSENRNEDGPTTEFREKRSFFKLNENTDLTNCVISFLTYFYEYLRMNVSSPFYSILSSLPNFGFFNVQTENDEVSNENSESSEINSYDYPMTSEYG